MLPASRVHAGEEVRVICEGAGGNPHPTLTLYLGSEQLAAEGQHTISATFVASPEQDGLVILCQAQNEVMDSPVEEHLQLEVLCKFFDICEPLILN